MAVRPQRRYQYTVEYILDGEERTLDDPQDHRPDAVEAAVSLEDDGAERIRVTKVEHPDWFDAPEVGEYVELAFEGEHGSQSPIKGRVTWVDTECEDIYQTRLFFGVDNGENNREIQYAEGEDDEGDQWSNVHRSSEFSGSHLLGDRNASWRRLD